MKNRSKKIDKCKNLIIFTFLALIFSASSANADTSKLESLNTDYFDSLGGVNVERLSVQQMQETEGEYYLIVLRAGGAVGLRFLWPISKKEAIKRLKQGKDVWSSSASQARAIAKAAAANGRAFRERTASVLRNNYNHYHDTYRNNGHSFFGRPSR